MNTQVDFSDVITYDGASILARSPLFSAAEEPEPEQDLWGLSTRVVSYLAEHFGQDRDDFVPEVLARAMPTLQECKTALNPDGPMDLIDQGLWGSSWRGQQVHGIRDAARDVARGGQDGWMLEPWPTDDKVGILDGLIEGMDLWESVVAADLEYHAKQAIERHLLEAQIAEARAVHRIDQLSDPATEQQKEYLRKQGYDQVDSLTEGEAHALIFGKDIDKAAIEHRMAVDRIQAALDEFYSYVPEPDIEPSPLFVYPVEQTDSVPDQVAKQTKCLARKALDRFIEANPAAAQFRRTLYRVLVKGGEFKPGEEHIRKAVWAKRQAGEHHWRLGNCIPDAQAARRANVLAAGFDHLEREQQDSDKAASASLSAEMEHLPVYLQPEHPYDPDVVEMALRKVDRRLIEQLRELAEPVRKTRLRVREWYSKAKTSPEYLWHIVKAAASGYRKLKEQTLQEMTELLTGLNPYGLSETELSGLAIALAGEVGLEFALVREAAGDALGIDIDDPDAWGRLYPAGWLGEEYESLIPSGSKKDVQAFAELAVDRDPTEIGWQLWHHQAAKQSHIMAALRRQSYRECCVAASKAFWALPDAKDILRQHNAALADHGMRRARVFKRDGEWVLAQRGGIGVSWRTVDEAGDVLDKDDLELVQAHLEALAENEERYRYCQVQTLDSNGVYDSQGVFWAWKDVAKAELGFASDKAKKTFASVAALLGDTDAQQVAAEVS